MTKTRAFQIHFAYLALTVVWLGLGLISVACWTFLYQNAVGFILSVLFLISLVAGPLLVVRYFQPSFTLWQTIIKRTLLWMLGLSGIGTLIIILLGKQITNEDPDGRFLMASPSAVLALGAIAGFFVLCLILFLFNRVSAWVGPKRNAA